MCTALCTPCTKCLIVQKFLYKLNLEPRDPVEKLICKIQRLLTAEPRLLLPCWFSFSTQSQLLTAAHCTFSFAWPSSLSAQLKWTKCFLSWNWKPCMTPSDLSRQVQCLSDDCGTWQLSHGGDISSCPWILGIEPEIEFCVSNLFSKWTWHAASSFTTYTRFLPILQAQRHCTSWDAYLTAPVSL